MLYNQCNIFYKTLTKRNMNIQYIIYRLLEYIICNIFLCFMFHAQMQYIWFYSLNALTKRNMNNLELVVDIWHKGTWTRKRRRILHELASIELLLELIAWVIPLYTDQFDQTDVTSANYQLTKELRNLLSKLRCCVVNFEVVNTLMIINNKSLIYIWTRIHNSSKSTIETNFYN